MVACRTLSLLASLLGVQVTAWVATCNEELSDGPKGATVEVHLGNLPPSAPGKPVYLTWWAGKKSTNNYNVLGNPASAQVHSWWYNAYAGLTSPAFNGGKVLVSESGEATMRVHTPATYWGCWGIVWPHIHFSICGQSGYPKRIQFTRTGAHVTGCWAKYKGKTLNYKVISVKDLAYGGCLGEGCTTTTLPTTTPLLALSAKEEEGKDFDALEFSAVYQCLEGKELFDQFSSKCTSKCPADADMVHGQCVRKQVAKVNQTLSLSWKLELDCNDKCWKDAMSTTHHSVRLALADHLDITFQEAQLVQIRRDKASPSTHAHLKVTVHTRRLEESHGRKLLAGFLNDATSATEVLGLPVSDITQVTQNDDANVAAAKDATEESDEKSDQYAQYYAKLEAEAEQRAKQNAKSSSIAGIEVPEETPVAAIVGAAAAVVVLLASAIFFLHRRQKKLVAQNDSNTVVIGNAVKDGKEVDLKAEDLKPEVKEVDLE